MRIRLERQDRQHVVDVAVHGARPSRPPRPNRRRDVIEDGDFGSAATNLASDPVGKIRTVDNDERMRACFDDHVGGFPDVAQNRGQSPRYSGEADDRKFIDRKRAFNPGRSHRAAADAR